MNKLGNCNNLTILFKILFTARIVLLCVWICVFLPCCITIFSASSVFLCSPWISILSFVNNHFCVNFVVFPRIFQLSKIFVVVAANFAMWNQVKIELAGRRKWTIMNQIRCVFGCQNDGAGFYFLFLTCGSVWYWEKKNHKTLANQHLYANPIITTQCIFIFDHDQQKISLSLPLAGLHYGR